MVTLKDLIHILKFIEPSCAALQTLLQESTAPLFSFEWPYFKISFTDPKTATTFYSITTMHRNVTLNT